jgi:hypothetical protein
MSDDLDAICRAYRHAERRIRYCANPLCPGIVASPESKGDDVGLLPEELPDLDEVPDVTDEMESADE